MYDYPLYVVPKGVETRWASHENPKGEKGQGGKARGGRKGSAWFTLMPGESHILAQAQNTSGMIRRIWTTINDQSSDVLRGVKIEFFWDGAEKPAVSAPYGDFFGVGIGRTAKFKSALFTNPEGRSFCCVIPMPFKTGMKVVVTNESEKMVKNFYYDIDYTIGDKHPEDVLYFHAYFNRQNPTTLKCDYPILPKVEGKGRYLGTNVGIIANTDIFTDTWWGEGEVKIYLDGDKEYPTIVGTGSEDYVGTAWGQDYFYDLYSGSPIYDKTRMEICWYRYHIPDPIYFHEDIQVYMQQIGGVDGDDYARISLLLYNQITKGAEYISVNGDLIDFKNLPNIYGVPNLFERSDDWSSCAYFYLDKPISNLPDIMPVEQRLIKRKEIVNTKSYPV
jgi:hypothetical protein